MGVYVNDLRSAVYAFPVLPFIIALPFMWWHYHKYARWGRCPVKWTAQILKGRSRVVPQLGAN